MCKKIQLKKFKWEDIEGKILVLYKNIPDELYSPSEDLTYTIYFGRKKVAIINLTCYEPKYVNIDMFEVFEKGKGYGGKIIQELQNCSEVETIELNPHDNNSCKFWIKMGFKMLNDRETMRWTK